MERKNWILMVSIFAIMTNTAVFGMEEEEEEDPHRAFAHSLQPQALDGKKEENSPMSEVCSKFLIDKDVDHILTYLEDNGAFVVDIMTGQPLILSHMSQDPSIPSTDTMPLSEERCDFFRTSVKALCTEYLRKQGPSQKLPDMLTMLISEFSMYGLYGSDDISLVKSRLKENLTVYQLADEHWSLGGDSAKRCAR